MQDKTLQDQLKQCPACAEMILAAAKKCRFCNEWLACETQEIDSSALRAPQKIGSSWLTTPLLFCGVMSIGYGAYLLNAHGFVLQGLAIDGEKIASTEVRGPEESELEQRARTQAMDRIAGGNGDGAALLRIGAYRNDFVARIAEWYPGTPWTSEKCGSRNSCVLTAQIERGAWGRNFGRVKGIAKVGRRLRIKFDLYYEQDGNLNWQCDNARSSTSENSLDGLDSACAVIVVFCSGSEMLEPVRCGS